MELKAGAALKSIDKMTSGIHIAAAQLLEPIIRDNQELARKAPEL
jgi:serine/threonine-protein kinase HipA